MRVERYLKLIWLIVLLSCTVQGQEMTRIDLESALLDINGRKFIPVSRINSEAMNRQFINLVNILREQQRILNEIDGELAEARGYDRRQLEKKRTELVEEMDKSNDFMIETYRYSINRNFMLAVEESYLYRKTTENEVFQLKEEQPDNDWDKSLKEEDGQLMILAHVLQGADDNKKFQSFIQTMNSQLAERNNNYEISLRVKSGYSQEYPDEVSRSNFIAWYDELESALFQNEAYLNQNYGVSLAQGYLQVILDARLYVEIKEEEIERLINEGSAALF